MTDAPCPTPPDPRDAELARYRAALAERDAALAQRDAELSQYRTALAERDAVLAERDAALAQRDEELSRYRAALAQRDATIQELTEAIQKLHRQVAWCTRKIFGRTSERYEDPSQPKLFEDPPASEKSADDDSSRPTISVQRRLPEQRGKRLPLPEDLPRQEIIHELPEDQRIDPKTGEVLLEPIGQEVSEKLGFRAGEIYVERHIRLKYRRVNHENLSGSEPEVLTTPLPREGLAKCQAAPSLLAHVVVGKYADHLPLHRLVKIFARHGVKLTKPTLCRWVQGVAELCQPLLGLMKQRLIASSKVIQHDDTPVRQLVPGAGRTQQCRFWSVVGQPGTPGHYILFQYTQNRSRAGPEAWFRDARGQPLHVGGYLQCDAYGGYQGLLDPQGDWKMVHVGCWAHARRPFDEARQSAPALAGHGLGLIRVLYDIEAQIKDLPPAQRRARRQDQALPHVDAFFAWCRQQQPQVLPKCAVGEAITYALNQETSLRRYLDDGELEIDNNACERSLRGIAIGRKNWLFAGAEAGGHAAAALFSLLASANLHGLQPLTYMQDLITHLPATSSDQLEPFLPDLWQASRRQS